MDRIGLPEVHHRNAVLAHHANQLRPVDQVDRAILLVLPDDVPTSAVLVEVINGTSAVLVESTTADLEPPKQLEPAVLFT